MKKLLLTVALLLFIGSSTAFGFGRKTVDNCTFTVTSTINLTSSNTACETPGGSTSWTLVDNSCGINLQANASDYAETSGPAADCNEIRHAPVDAMAGDKVKGVDITATLTDGGTLSSTDTYCIWAGTSAANNYTVCARDDNSLSFRVYKEEGGVSTSLGTFGAQASGESSVITLRASADATGTGITAYDNGTNSFTNAGGDISPASVGIGCGGIQVSTDDCPGAGAARWDNFSAVIFTGKWWKITDIIPWVTKDAYAQDAVREGRWYISPVITVDNTRMPKLATINDPGAPLLLDNDGNATIPQQCLYSAAIGSKDVPNEWSLVYALCYDYSAIEADPEIKLLVDEKAHSLQTKLTDMPSKERTEFNNIATKKAKKAIPLSEENSVNSWLNEIGKEVNPKFNTRSTYTNR